jgi:hypothetical protein
MDENRLRFQLAADCFRVYRAVPFFLDGVNWPVTPHASPFA